MWELSRGGKVTRFWRAVFLLIAWSLAAASWAQSDAEIVAQGESLVRAGRYADAYKLLEPLEDRLAGSLKFDYLLARSALEIGQPSKASFIYERILAVEPNYVGVRLEMGRAYLALGDYARAKLEFETVLRFQNLPADLRQQAQVYGKAAEEYLAGKKTVGHAYLEYGYGYDSNPQSATRISEISLAGGGTLLLPQTALPQGDQYHALAVGGELAHALSDKISIFLGVDGRARQYTDLSVANWGTVDGRTGLGYNSGVHNVRFAVTGGRFWLDSLKTRDSSGATLDYRYLAGKQDQISVGIAASRNKFLPDALKINSYDLYQGSIGLLHGAADGRGAAGVTLVGGIENELNGRVDGDRPFVGTRLTLQRAFTGSVGAFLVAGAQYGKYSETNPLFGVRRADKLYDVTAGVSWSFAKGWSLRPQVLYMKNQSNLPLYEYDRTDVSLNLRVDL
ncbi:MAG: tetratricopeptide repeat protein [Burkholderiales bacterium]